MSNGEAAPWQFDGAPVRVIDGDTVVVEGNLFVDLRREFVVRLLEVDTPELRAKDTAERERALAAKRFTWDFMLTEGGHLRPLKIALTGRKDVYGRYLGWVSVAGVDLSRALIEAGHGEARTYAAHLRELTGEVEE